MAVEWEGAKSKCTQCFHQVVFELCWTGKETRHLPRIARLFRVSLSRGVISVFCSKRMLSLTSLNQVYSVNNWTGDWSRNQMTEININHKWIRYSFLLGTFYKLPGKGSANINKLSPQFENYKSRLKCIYCAKIALPPALSFALSRLEFVQTDNLSGDWQSIVV